MGGVKMDKRGFDRFIRGLRRLSRVPERVAKLSAGGVTSEAQRAFDAGQSPNGEAWPATKTQGPRRLNDTGRLRAAATSFAAKGRRLVASIAGVKYARFQNPRLFLPKKPIPDAWRAVIDSKKDEAIRSVVEGR